MVDGGVGAGISRSRSLYFCDRRLLHSVSKSKYQIFLEVELVPVAQLNSAETVEALAAELGESVYIDVAKWHLYLRDAHLHTLLAEQLLPLLGDGDLTEGQVTDVLKAIPVKLGGGKREVPLADLLPMQVQVQLMDILEEFQRKL